MLFLVGHVGHRSSRAPGQAIHAISLLVPLTSTTHASRTYRRHDRAPRWPPRLDGQEGTRCPGICRPKRGSTSVQPRVEFSSDDDLFIQIQANILLTATSDVLSSRALAVPLVRHRSQIVVSVPADVTAPQVVLSSLSQAHISLQMVGIFYKLRSSWTSASSSDVFIALYLTLFLPSGTGP